MTKRPTPGVFIEDLLHRLNSTECGAAWSEFIDHYAPVIMRAAREFDYEQNRSGECFLYVCEKLSDDSFRRLLSFNTRGKARFTTWLGSVVFNLCVDWHRKEFSRAQLLPAISALPAFDQAVYLISFKREMSFEASFETLRSDFPDLTRQQLSDAIARIHRLLTPRQRWQITVQNRRHRRWVLSSGPEPDRLPNDNTGPEKEAQSAYDQEALGNSLSALDNDQRMLLHLRFQQGLTLKKIAEIMQLGDEFRTRRQIQTALDTLRAKLNQLARAART